MVEKLGSCVTFEHVRFGYEAGKTIISDFSVQVEAGQTVAIVGPTGAGKTTGQIADAFYEIQSGSIKIDSVDIRDLTRTDLRSRFGMVLQDATLFTGTIMENIRYGNLEAGDEAVIERPKPLAWTLISAPPGRLSDDGSGRCRQPFRPANGNSSPLPGPS